MSDNEQFPLELTLKKQAGPMSESTDGKRHLYRDPVSGKRYMVEELVIHVTHPET